MPPVSQSSLPESRLLLTGGRPPEAPRGVKTRVIYNSGLEGTERQGQTGPQCPHPLSPAHFPSEDDTLDLSPMLPGVTTAPLHPLSGYQRPGVRDQGVPGLHLLQRLQGGVSPLPPAPGGPGVPGCGRIVPPLPVLMWPPPSACVLEGHSSLHFVPGGPDGSILTLIPSAKGIFPNKGTSRVLRAGLRGVPGPPFGTVQERGDGICE